MSKHEFNEIRIAIERNNPAIYRDESLCIKCGQCRNVCRNEIAVGKMYDLSYTNDTAICIHCGQCANVCPVSSIQEVDDVAKIKAALNDPNKIVVISTSPSVRAALGEEFNMPVGSFVEGKMVAALRALNIPYVLDTNFAADLTIMEEANELIERITKKNKPLPQFTSCCPAWVKFVETFYPEFIPNISTAKSPISMQGPTIKTYFASKNQLDPKKIVNVALTPCTAKKYEILRDEMNDAGKHLGIEGMRDMDYVITTRELARWLKAENIDFDALEPASYDSFMGAASGAGVIFGNTGGVMEAAVRTAYHEITKDNLPSDMMKLTDLRGLEGIKEASLDINGVPVKVAVVHGTENARILLEKIKSGEAHYDFIEVMTCRGGCIAGGGQPKTIVPMNDEIRLARIDALYTQDEKQTLRFSHDNPEVQTVYQEFYKAPLSELAEKMLHTHYQDKSAILNRHVMDLSEPTKQWKCSICGYIAEMDSIPSDYLCPLCGVGKDLFEEVQIEKPVEVKATGWKCAICGYIAEMVELPDDYICPLCGVGKDLFNKE